MFKSDSIASSVINSSYLLQVAICIIYLYDILSVVCELLDGVNYDSNWILPSNIMSGICCG